MDKANGGSLRWMLPSGWFAQKSVTLVHPEGYANIIFSSEPSQDGDTTDDFAARHLDSLNKEFPGFRLLGKETVNLAGAGRATQLDFQWSPEDMDPVHQLQIVCVHEGRSYVATASARDADFARCAAAMKAALRSLSVVTGESESLAAGL